MSRTGIALRICAFAAAMVLIWKGALPMLAAAGGSPLRLAAGALVSAAVLAVVLIALRVDRLGLRAIGHRGDVAGLRAFLAGMALWLLPALAGTALCLAMGWTTIRLESPPATVLAALPALALGVLLVEAFPEELAFRGYLQGLLARRTAQWIALLVQAALFVLFAWAIGALGSAQQWMFIPGFGLILGLVRALSGSFWTSMGVHFAWMTTTQLLLGHAGVEGLQTLLFVAFTLLPSATLGTVLSLKRPGFRWKARTAANAG